MRSSSATAQGLPLAFVYNLLGKTEQSADRGSLGMYSFPALAATGKIEGRIMPFLTSQERENKV